MKKKQTIQILKEFNEWRRWADKDMPDPKIVGKAIDNAIISMEAWNFVEYQGSQKERADENEKLFSSSVKELRFANMQIEALYNTLDEIASMTSDPLTKQVAELAKERHQLDKLIHSRNLFN